MRDASCRMRNGFSTHENSARKSLLMLLLSSSSSSKNPHELFRWDSVHPNTRTDQAPLAVQRMVSGSCCTSQPTLLYSTVASPGGVYILQQQQQQLQTRVVTTRWVMIAYRTHSRQLSKLVSLALLVAGGALVCWPLKFKFPS